MLRNNIEFVSYACEKEGVSFFCFLFFFNLQSPLLSPDQYDVFPVGWSTLFFVDPEKRKHPRQWLRTRLRQYTGTGGGFASSISSSGVAPPRLQEPRRRARSISEVAVTRTTNTHPNLAGCFLNSLHLCSLTSSSTLYEASPLCI